MTATQDTLANPGTVGFIPAPPERMKAKPDENRLSFGKIFTDYMFVMDYEDGAWRSARIQPYGSLMLDPACSALHYSQSVFEGLKAYRAADGSIRLFRARDNFERMNVSCDRLCVPRIDVDFALEAMKRLLRLEAEWAPSAPDTTMYIRPTIIAVDPYLGVHASEKYLFYIILSPSGPYFPDGMAPVRIYVEDEYVRAARGGMGFAKTGGNYAASILAGAIAQKKGFTQVLWLDGTQRRFVEEVGSMNIFFKVRGELWTPRLNGSILPGITRSSVLALAQAMGVRAVEKDIDIYELFDLGARGELEEAFGSGTAAVISPVGMLRLRNRDLIINNFQTGPLSQRLYDTLTGVQYGRLTDPFGWTETL
ncbi:MAG: branched-chain amino acid aminotransferase [Oscillospiraceae bacterium]|jgi:branched-chain amino acid aminotransferase|nr:branched-chain amino acid aminotransferase [Oscillospiraceae bacterium]